MIKYTLFGTESPWIQYIIKDDDLDKLKKEASSRLLIGQTATIIDNESYEIINLETI